MPDHVTNFKLLVIHFHFQGYFTRPLTSRQQFSVPSNEEFEGGGPRHFTAPRAVPTR